MTLTLSLPSAPAFPPVSFPSAPSPCASTVPAGAAPRKPSFDEQAVLREVVVRLITLEERSRFDDLICAKHYLHSASMVGEQLRYVAVLADGTWLGLLSWCAAARYLAPRDRWIGWTQDQRRHRLALVANNSRFLILAEAGALPNLASRAMRLCLDRLSEDWQLTYAHPIVVVESFVDTQLFRGTAYKASGWQALGPTQGFARNAQDFYVAHQRPKQIWVRELAPGTRAKLCLATDQLPPAWAAVSARIAPRCTQTCPELSSLRVHFKTVPDPRSRRSLHYPMSGMLTLIACATMSGVARGQRDLAAYGRTLSQYQLRALGFHPSARAGGKILPPCEATIFKILCIAPPAAVEQALLAWQEEVPGPLPAGEMIAIDGKTLCSSQGVEIVNAFAPVSGRWLGSEIVEEGSNEITAARRLIVKLDLENRLVCLDALHTQRETACQAVQETGGNYLFTVKANQAKVMANLNQQIDASASLSPSGHSPGH